MFAIAPLLPGFQQVLNLYTLTATPTLFIRPDPRRAILYVSNGTAVALSLWVDPAVPAGAPAHIPIPPGGMQRFTWPLDGPMSTFGWLGALASGTGTVAVTEILWHPENLGHNPPGG